MKKTLCLLLSIVLFSLPLSARAEALTAYTLGAWLPYWEAEESLDELGTLCGALDAAVAFACIFDAADQPLMLPEAEDLLTAVTQACEGTGAIPYLSIVNDVETAPNTYDNKSTALLSRLLADDASISQHLEALIALIDLYHLQGLELDYENLKGDTVLWANYAQLISRLWDICARDAIRLRVVLPWDAPKYADLPAGPEYTVMCYNLYGYHSGPGPKADLAFLEETCALYQSQPYTTRMAFSTGGFIWQDGKARSVTQTQAEAQLQSAAVTPVRDAASQALTATYQLEGEAVTLWYADAITLAAWRGTCAAYGFTAFDLFRLGGNDVSSLVSFTQASAGETPWCQQVITP